MGKSQKLLHIVVLRPLNEWEEVKTLEQQGHIIRTFSEDADLIIGPTAWFMDDAHRKYLDLAIKSAQARRYPTKT